MATILKYSLQTPFNSGDKLQIYKGALGSGFVKPATSALLTTLTTDTGLYIDTGVVDSNTGYVVAHVRANGEVAYSEVNTINLVNDTGPGPDTLVSGDGRFGSFGAVSRDMVDGGTITGYTSGSGVSYEKLLINGRYLYVCKATINGTDIRTAVAAGKGSGGVQPANSTSAVLTLETDTIHSYRGAYFRARLPKLIDYNNKDTSTANYGYGMPKGKSELMDIMSLYYPTYNTQTVVSCDTFAGVGNRLIAVNNSSFVEYNFQTRTDGVSFIVLEYIGSNPDKLPAIAS